MKKALAILAVALMVVGLTGCMDAQDGSKQKDSSSISLYTDICTLVPKNPVLPLGFL